MMVSGSHKAEDLSLFKTSIDSIPAVSATHIVVIGERMSVTHGASML